MATGRKRGRMPKINKKIKEEYKDKIKIFMNEYNFTELESLCYLYFFNNAHIRLKDFKDDFGRPMFIKFARCVGELLESEEE